MPPLRAPPSVPTPTCLAPNALLRPQPSVPGTETNFVLRTSASSAATNRQNLPGKPRYVPGTNHRGPCQEKRSTCLAPNQAPNQTRHPRPKLPSAYFRVFRGREPPNVPGTNRRSTYLAPSTTAEVRAWHQSQRKSLCLCLRKIYDQPPRANSNLRAWHQPRLPSAYFCVFRGNEPPSVSGTNRRSTCLVPTLSAQPFVPGTERPAAPGNASTPLI